MKIQYAVMSCNANPEYLDFWPCVARAWQGLGIKPVLFFIPDRAGVSPEAVADTEVHIIRPLAGVHTILQASMLRFWGTGLYPDDVTIVSDIDMLPLSKEFFVTQLADIDENRYVHLRCVRANYESCSLNGIPGEVTEIEQMRYINACYHVAKGALMREVWGFSSNWESSCKKTIPYHHVTWGAGGNNHAYVIKGPPPDGCPFYASGDELYSSVRFHRFSRQEVFHFITYLPERFDMFHRSAWDYDPRKLEQGYYSAAHLPRPYGDYREVIDRLVDGVAMPRVYRLCFATITGMMRFRWRVPIVGDYLSFVLILPWLVGGKVIGRFSDKSEVTLLRMYAGHLLSQLKKENVGLRTWHDRWRRRMQR